MTPPDFDRALFDRRVSAATLRLRAASPFFATLTLFARIAPRLDLPTAATNGRDIWISPFFAQALTPAQLDGLILHEVLHAALGHVLRRGAREPLAWNVAADIVVNGIIANETKLTLPPRALRDAALESLSVEEVYELLLRDIARLPPLDGLDLLEVWDESDGDVGGPGALTEERRAILETYWRNACEQAAALARSLGQGNLPAGLNREWARCRGRSWTGARTCGGSWCARRPTSRASTAASSGAGCISNRLRASRCGCAWRLTPAAPSRASRSGDS